MKKRVMLVTAVLAAAVAVLVAGALPPEPIALVAGEDDGTVPGALHVHSNRSDGRSSPDEIVASAARAGLRFLVFTDHGDATRQPDPPRYQAGVLCLDGVEISTTGGHYLVLDMPPAPYPLGGEPRDVIEDVRRLGGFGIAAHPDSPKPELQWREWTAPFDGIETVNPDTSWRLLAREPRWEPRLRLVEALLAYPFRPAAVISSLIDPSAEILARWDALTLRRRLVGIAGVDAHAKLALRDVDPADNRLSIPLPSYESSFRTMSVHVQPARPLTGDAAADARTVIGAIREGHLYTALNGLASPPAFQFTASNERGTAQAGDELAAAGAVRLRVRNNAPASFDTIVLQGSRVLASRSGDPDFTVTAPADPGVYRVVVRASDRPRQPSWILSNPIYIRGPQMRQPPERRPATTRRSLFDGRTGDAWRFEADPTSVAALEVATTLSGPRLRLRYGLAGGRQGGQFAALAVNTPGGIAAFDRLAFTARAEQPMRISVQVRVAVTPVDDERWQRSVYVDTEEEDRVVYFEEFTPIAVPRTLLPPLAAVHSIVFAIDMTNAKPATSGRVWLGNVMLGR
jgi:hypothetical protein